MLSTSLESILFAYKTAEQNIIGENIHVPTFFRNEGNEEEDPDGGVDILWDLLSNTGLLGQYLSTLGGMFVGDYGNVISSYLLLFSYLVENAFSENPASVTNLLCGLDISQAVIDGIASLHAGESVTESIFSEIYNQYHHLTSNSVDENIVAACQWLSVAVINIFDNYEEYGRFATFGIAAPTIAVGALTVGVYWGINEVVESITGKDLGELISDIVLEIGDSFGSIDDGLEAGISAVVSEVADLLVE